MDDRGCSGYRLLTYTCADTNPQDTTAINFLDQSLNDPMFYASPTLPVMTSSDGLSSYDILGGDISSMTPLTPSLPGTPPMSDSTSTHEEYIIYYFNHVRPFQFVFAGNSVTSLLYTVRIVDRRSLLHVNSRNLDRRFYMRNPEVYCQMPYVLWLVYIPLVYGSRRGWRSPTVYHSARYPNSSTTRQYTNL